MKHFLKYFVRKKFVVSHVSIKFGQNCHNISGWQERIIKGNLMRRFTHTGYYRYRNGSRPITPDVEAYIRQLLKGHGITQEPHFDGYVETYVW